MAIRGVTNKQREVVGLSLNNCLLTLTFLKGRDLVRPEVCPREGCRGQEKIRHIFLEFVKEVWVEGFVRSVVGVNRIMYESGVLGVVEGGKLIQQKNFCFFLQSLGRWCWRHVMHFTRRKLY